MRRRASTFLLLFLPMLMLAMSFPVWAATSVFINEIHYDNGGKDTGEAVEVAGPAGTDLTGWTLVLYNGNGGASYGSIALSGILADQQAGFGTRSFARSRIQNGAPDGVALIAPGGRVAQFLSYEGIFIAVDGPAAGMSSVNIGPQESYSTLVGCSLQLSGTGAVYEDFTWIPPSPNTFGHVNAGQTFRSSSDTPPFVSKISPSHREAHVAVDADLTIHFNEKVAVSGVWFALQCAHSGSHTATAGEAGTTYLLKPDTDFANNETCTLTIFADQVVDVDGVPNTMTGDLSVIFTTIAESSITKIHDIQGAGGASPVEKELRAVEGVVVGDFQDVATQLRGFFVQEEDADADLDPATSEGIFVYDNGFGVDVRVGDVVRVRGFADEFFEKTQLKDLMELTVLGRAAVLPRAVPVALPFPDESFLERYEGMRICFPQTLTVTGQYDVASYGEVLLSSGGRLMTPTNVAAPGQAANALQSANNLNCVLLDDGSTGPGPDPIPYPAPSLTAANTLRVGDTVSNLRGVLDFAFREYRVHPTESPVFVPANPRISAPEPVGGTLKVAGFNLFNYFTTIDDGVNDARGADSDGEFRRQRAKIIAAIAAMDADIVGIMELENNERASILSLVNNLNSAIGPGTYAFIDTRAFGGDPIRVALLYKPKTVTPVGPSLIDAAPVFERNPLAQTFEDARGARVTVVVNHFTSKNCRDATGLDRDQRDGQSCYNRARTLQARQLLAFIEEVVIPASNDPDVLILGDLNAYAREDPIIILEKAGFLNLLKRFLGENVYSYVYYGQSGSLDYALANRALLPQVTGATVWHINADEPRALDYNDDVEDTSSTADTLNLPSLYHPAPYRSSDHDPVLIGLDLDELK